MKTPTILVVFALISILAYSGQVIVGQYQPILTVRQSSQPHHFNAEGQIPVVFSFGTITVPKQMWFVGLHGHAYRQMTYLYPAYRTLAVRSCAYTIYGPSRIYQYELLGDTGSVIRVFSSVQNNDEATGEETQQTVQEQAHAERIASQASEENKVDEEHSGFSVIKLSRAYQIPRVALAIKGVTRAHWREIRYSPLVRCLERWEKGTYLFRLFFSGIPRWFEYRQVSSYESHNQDYENKTANLRNEEVQDFYDEQIQNLEQNSQDEKSYLPIQRPIFTVKQIQNYEGYSLEDFKKHPGYHQIINQFNQHFGHFDEKWISRIQYRDDSNTDYFQVNVKFVPFLVDVDFEAHYYGSTEKASILKIDEKVFNGQDNRKYFNSWNQITEFNSYKAFKEANEYVLSQFTYLRHYKVTAAYSALHKNGRYVRLVYQSQNGLFSFKGENQFNIVVYINDGKFYIDRNDFHATNTYSFGKNDWISFFVKVEDINTHADYHRIVKFFMTHYLEFWHAHRVEELYFKDNLFVVKFRNPSNAVKEDEQEKVCVLDVQPNYIKALNHFDWKRQNSASIQHTKALEYIKSRYTISAPMFVNYKVSPYGRHYQVSYLNDQNTFASAYLRYVDGENLFVEDEYQGIVYGIDFNEIALPENPEESLIAWVTNQDSQIIAIVEVTAVDKNTFNIVALTNGQRWLISVQWVKGKWVFNAKSALHDGYYFLTGYPSVNVASCTGYLARLYPAHFRSNWLYTFIEVKNIGYFVYNRVIYRINNEAYQGIIRTTYGVENSHTLISWDKIRYLRNLEDYGYGREYIWNYGYDHHYFFDYGYIAPHIQINIDAKKEQNHQKDLLCSYWDGDKCIACYGDYYADNSGRCVRIEEECEFWKISGTCSKCSYGWTVNKYGKCEAVTTVHYAVSV